MLAATCLAFALAPPPTIVVVVVDGPEAARAELQQALAADPTVSAQPQSLVDQLLAGGAAAGLVCTFDDAPCWTKIGLDGELDQLVVASTVVGGAFELRLVDIGAGHEVGRVAVAPGAQLDARAALARLLHPEAAPISTPPVERVADERTRTSPPEEAPAVPSPAGPISPSMLWVAAGGAAAVGVACGIVAASVDGGLTEMLIAARDNGVPLDRDRYDSQENTQNLLIVCGAVAGAAAIASATGALVVE